MISKNSARQLCKTGIAGLDDILGGGFPSDRLYLLQGNPGAGKTTLALQFLLEGARAGEKVLYVTLSETRDELNAVAESHGWELDPISVIELSAIEKQLLEDQQNTFFHPSEMELGQTTKILTEEVEKVKPARVVFDSLSEMRLLAENALRYRRQMLVLKQFFAGRHTTVLFLDDCTSGQGGDLQIQSIAHGVILLEKSAATFGAHRRRMEVCKLRGVKFRDGMHDYAIVRGGLEVFPQLVAADHHCDFVQEPVPTGVKELDALLGGGLDRGTSTLMVGPAGVGKTTLSMLNLVAAARRGERSVAFSFDENTQTLRTRMTGVGMPIDGYLESGLVRIQRIDPAELSPGQFACIIRDEVEKHGVRLVLIDSMNGYLNATPNEKFLTLQLHELLTFLCQQGVVCIMTLAQHGLFGNMETPVDLTYLADTVVVLRYFEADGRVKKAISVVKKRSGFHEDTIREFKFESTGIRIGLPVTEFRGVLTGSPTFIGKPQAMLSQNSA